MLKPGHLAGARPEQWPARLLSRLPIAQPTRRAIIRIALSDGVRCGRCEPESICSSRRRTRNSTTNPRIRRNEHNLSATSVAVTNTLASQLDAFRQKTSTSKEAPKVSTDPDLQERLNALGYVASDSSASAMLGIKDTGADPKDKVEVVNLLHRAEMFKEEMHFAEAVPLLEQVIALEPNLPITYLQLGTALTSLKDYEKAVPVLRKAVEMRPDLTVPRYQLGSALFETGDFAAAAVQFETAVARSPNWPEAHLSLATAYARADRLTGRHRGIRKGH